MEDLISTSVPSGINWLGLVGVPITAICGSLLLVPAPFLRTLNGIPLSLFSSCGILLGSLAAWAINGFEASSDGEFFHPSMMIGGCAFTLFVIFGVLAVRFLGIAGAGCTFSGAAVLGLWVVDHFGVFPISFLKLPKILPCGAEDPQWLVYAAGIVVIIGSVLGLCIPVDDGLESAEGRLRKGGYGVIGAINSELGTYNEDSSEDIDVLQDKSLIKKKKYVPRPAESDALEDSAINRLFMDRSVALRRFCGIIFVILAGGSLVVQLVWLLYGQQMAVNSIQSSSIFAGGEVLSVSQALKIIPMGDVFAFSCGAFISSIFFVVLFGIFACNKPSLPPQGTLPCVIFGFAYAFALLAWLFANIELGGAMGDFPSWGLSCLFTAIAGIFFKQQKGVAGHLLAAISVFFVLVGSTLLAVAQRGIKNLD